MSIQADLVELEHLHRALEREIQEELAHPGSDDLKLAELKRRKLQLKDRIERLKHETSATVLKKLLAHPIAPPASNAGGLFLASPARNARQ